MKKILALIIAVMIIPLMVFADVDENTQTTQWEVSTNPDAPTLCSNAESLNNTTALQNGTSGYYIYCIKISCTNGVNVHTIEHPLSGALTCSNGNQNPNAVISSSGAQGEELRSGASCSENGVYAYATEKMYYNCALTTTQVPITSRVTTTRSVTTTQRPVTTTGAVTTTQVPETTTTSPVVETTTTAPVGEDTTTVAPVQEETTTVKSPETGVEDYFLALGGTIAVLVAGLYVIDKKNIFKKI